MLQQIYVLVCEIDPNFNSVERLVIFGRDEAETIDVLAMVEIFP